MAKAHNQRQLKFTDNDTKRSECNSSKKTLKNLNFTWKLHHINIPNVYSDNFQVHIADEVVHLQKLCNFISQSQSKSKSYCNFELVKYTSTNDVKLNNYLRPQ